MAVAVPLLMGAMGAGTLAIAVTSVAFAVTGVNDAINEAASDVFGKDLVSAFNVIGSVYALGSGLGGETGGLEGLGDAPGYVDGLTASETAGLDELAKTPEALAAADASSAVDFASAGKLADVGIEPGWQTDTVAQATPASATTPTTSAQQPTTTTAQASPDTLARTYKDASGSVTVDQGTGALKGTQPLSVVDRLTKLVTNPDGSLSNGALTMGGNILKGAFEGYSASKTRAQQQANLEAQLAREKYMANLGSAGWRQTQ